MSNRNAGGIRNSTSGDFGDSVEKGFAVSSVDVDPWGNGAHLGDYELE